MLGWREKSRHRSACWLRSSSFAPRTAGTPRSSLYHQLPAAWADIGQHCQQRFLHSVRLALHAVDQHAPDVAVVESAALEQIARRPFTLGGIRRRKQIVPTPPAGCIRRIRRMAACSPMPAPSFGIESMCPAASFSLPIGSAPMPPCLITYCGYHPPSTASAPMPIPGLVSGSGFSGSFRCSSEDVRRALAECCATAHGEASCIGSGDPGDSRRAPLKRVRNREQGFCRPNG